MDCPKRNALAGLPDEAMLKILARVPFRSICRSKCVAKAWRDLIEDPLNRRKLPQTLQGFFSMFNPMRKLDDDSEHFFIKYLASPLPLDIDPCLSFLMKLPETESFSFLDSCNGLLLFEHCPKSNPHDVLSYVVCNPATKHWGTVPVRACCRPLKSFLHLKTYLAFDPAVSPHFHLIQFWREGWDEATSVRTYSSETGVWSQSQTDWNEQGQLEGWRRPGSLKYGCHKRAFVNGILHLIVSGLDQHQIVAVDVEGKTKWIITTPDAKEGCIGQSQGRLHYISEYFDDHVQGSVLSIWELKDYDTQEWMCKDTVSFLILFGTMTAMWDYVFIHPDRNEVFLLQPLNRLIAYGMDSKEVSVVFMSSENLEGEIVPYIPTFSQSPTLTNKD